VRLGSALTQSLVIGHKSTDPFDNVTPESIVSFRDRDDDVAVLVVIDASVGEHAGGLDDRIDDRLDVAIGRSVGDVVAREDDTERSIVLARLEGSVVWHRNQRVCMRRKGWTGRWTAWRADRGSGDSVEMGSDGREGGASHYQLGDPGLPVFRRQTVAGTTAREGMA